MCGVMGLISRSRQSDFAKAFQSFKHRGPDASTTRIDQFGGWQVELGHHRLSIIDLADGHQPMQSEETTVVFNGEIYNYQNIRQSLNSQFKTNSDTEVLLELFCQKGVEGLGQLDGFFAAGFVNSADQSVTLVRDRWGIKPLYFAPLADGGLMFASELTPFMHIAGIEKKLSKSSLRNYLFWQYYPSDQTPLAGVFKLRPGHYLCWLDGQFEVRSYFNPHQLLQQTRRWRSRDELWDDLCQTVHEAMVADVPVGILLSGGIDSSLIAVAAHKKKGEGIPTFSIGFRDQDFDESGYARTVAEQIGSEHHEHILSEGDLLESWRSIVLSLDEPLADPSILPTHFLCQLARSKVKVVLGGDGGDELFGGYPTYRAHQFFDILASVPSPLFETLRSLLKHHLRLSSSYQPLSWKLKRLIGRFDQDPIQCHHRWMSATDIPELATLFAQSPEGMHYDGDIYGLNVKDLQSFMLMDLTHYLPGSVLSKVDRASMGVGLEVRPPFLSNGFVERAFRLPLAQKVDVDESKVILRELARMHLPEAITERSKRGFAIPLRRWLKNELQSDVAKILKESPLFEGSYLQPEPLRKMWKEFLDGTGDHERMFWALLVLNEWVQAHDIKVSESPSKN